jgi:transcriptional regulator with XRE-family HTH domain
MKTYRNELRLSQSKLAGEVNSATNYIAAIEAGRKFPSVAMLEKIAFALKIDTPELFSMKSVQTDSIKQLHETILMEIEGLISDCISEKLENLR